VIRVRARRAAVSWRYARGVNDSEPAAEPQGDADAATPSRPRPIVERIGLGAVALLLAFLFGLMSVAAFQGGELFLAVMSGIGCLMVVWVGGLTILRGR
jgi:hypothetical protein